MLLVAILVFLIFTVTILCLALVCQKVAGWDMAWRDVAELALGAFGISLTASLLVTALLKAVQP